MKLSILWYFFCCILNATTPKKMPPNSPMFYYHIAEASYRSNPQAYLDHALGEDTVKVFDREAAGSCWGFTLIVDLVHNRSMVSFQGAVNLKCWCANVKHAVKKPKSLYEEMEETLMEWQKRLKKKGYGEIADFVGHSRGGDFVHQLKKDWPIFRITFNGYHCQTGQGICSATTLNLRVRKDLVSRRPFSNVRNYLTIESAERFKVKKLLARHHLKVFAMASTATPELVTNAWLSIPSPLKEISWHELLPGYFASEELAIAQQRDEPK
jgi:hypothetical protein